VTSSDCVEGTRERDSRVVAIASAWDDEEASAWDDEASAWDAEVPRLGDVAVDVAVLEAAC
jgi:hypothetical protein